MSTKDLVLEWLNSHKGSDVIDTDAAWEHFVKIVTNVANFCLEKQMEEIREYMKTHSWYNKEWYNYFDEMSKELNDAERP